MAQERIHSIDLKKTASYRDVQWDSRTLGQRFAATCRKPHVMGIACFMLAGVAWFFPALVDVAALGGLVAGVIGRRIKPDLPLKLPAGYPGLDPHEREPGTRRTRKARGILFLGNDRTTGEELYLSDDDARTHLLVLGGTGSGKTEAMTGLAANTLLWGSGYTYVDGKGDAALWAKTFALARACGREDDLYVLNYLTGSTDVDPSAPSATRLSNTFNPFLHGSADALTQMLVAQMAEAGGDSATWKDKAIGLLTAYVRAMVAMRDRGLDERGQPFLLDAGALRACITLDHLIDLYLRARDRVDGFMLPGPALESLRTYLESVPGFQEPARLMEQQGMTLTPEAIRRHSYPPQPDPQTYLQHGYLQNQFGRMFGQLADVYGHIFQGGHGEIDLTDVVLNRRILVVMLPALEKSPDELASLGKLLIASLKNMLAVGLGACLEGSHRTVIERRPVAAPSPYLGVFDEYGYYAVKGFAVVPAQARSLGFAVCFGGQDLQSFGKESKEEADAIVANTLTKIGMFIEDPKDTADLFEKLGGSTLTVQSSGLTKSDSTLLTGAYRDTPNGGFERHSRLDLLDLREQGPGEAHILRGTTIVRADMFYPGALKASEYRLNRFVAQGFDPVALRVALTPESVRRAVAQVVTPPLDMVQIGSVRKQLESYPPSQDNPNDPSKPNDPTADTQRQTFAKRFIADYLGAHAALDAEFAQRFREAAAERDESDEPDESNKPDEAVEGDETRTDAAVAPPVDKSPKGASVVEAALGSDSSMTAAALAAAIDDLIQNLEFDLEEGGNETVAGSAYQGGCVALHEDGTFAVDSDSKAIQGEPKTREKSKAQEQEQANSARRAVPEPRLIAVDRLEDVFVADARQIHADLNRVHSDEST